MTCSVIVAAGKGIRMGTGVDKLFLYVAGAPVVGHTWCRFEEAGCIDHIILVIREGMQSKFEQLAVQMGFRKPFQIVTGGAERQDSVWNGLEAVPGGCDLVAIQDAARPCTSQETIAATIEAARANGAAVAATPLTDTIKETADGKWVVRTLDRSRIWAVQTPQAFRVEILRNALSSVRARGLNITDDTAACELIGQPVALVQGTGPNPKVTRPEDLPYVELLLAQQAKGETKSTSPHPGKMG